MRLQKFGTNLKKLLMMFKTLKIMQIMRSQRHLSNQPIYPSKILLRRSNLEEALAVTNPPLEASDPNATVVMEEENKVRLLICSDNISTFAKDPV